jgi:hypothetical protein
MSSSAGREEHGIKAFLRSRAMAKTLFIMTISSSHARRIAVAGVARGCAYDILEALLLKVATHSRKHSDSSLPDDAM